MTAIIKYILLCSTHYNLERMEKIEGETEKALHPIALVALTGLNIVSTQNRHLLSKYQYGFLLG